MTSGQVGVVVPFAANGFQVAQFQVDNNGAVSNTVTMLVNATTPGVFSANASGLGYGAIEHADGTLVTSSSPAQPGETVMIFVAGLGLVFPPVPDGTQAPVSPLSYTSPANDITADVHGTAATITFEGLAPYLIGLYQINLTIPSTATAGDNYVEIMGPDSDNLQALIPIGSGGTPGARPRQRSRSYGKNMRATKPRSAACFFVCKTGGAASSRFSPNHPAPQPAE